MNQRMQTLPSAPSSVAIAQKFTSITSGRTSTTSRRYSGTRGTHIRSRLYKLVETRGCGTSLNSTMGSNRNLFRTSMTQLLPSTTKRNSLLKLITLHLKRRNRPKMRKNFSTVVWTNPRSSLQRLDKVCQRSVSLLEISSRKWVSRKNSLASSKNDSDINITRNLSCICLIIE